MLFAKAAMTLPTKESAKAKADCYFSYCHDQYLRGNKKGGLL